MIRNNRYKGLGEAVLKTALPIVILWLYCVLTFNFFPNGNGMLGHDFALFFPHLLDGTIWFKSNGLWQIPWFTPSFGGGLPKFPNPQSMFFSVPQFLCFTMDPLSSVKITVIIFAGLGFSGFYTLLRNCFKTSYLVALAGATLFLFNGFFLHRMVVGHLPYHSFMLLPWISYLVLANHNKIKQRVFQILCGGVLFSYSFYSGAFHLLPIIILATFTILLIHNIYIKSRLKTSLINFALIGLVSVCMSASIMYASIQYIGNFPRDFYPLPGISSTWGLIKVFFYSLFIEAPREMGNSLLSENIGGFGKHEFEYGITFIPFVLSVVTIYLFVRRSSWNEVKPKKVAFGLLTVILLLPFIINIYTPTWNGILKEIPFIKSSSILLRWVSYYIPVVILIGIIALNELKTHYSNLISIATVVIVILINFTDNRDSYHYDSYEPSTIVNTHNEIISNNKVINITAIAKTVDSTGVSGNDILVGGLSQIEPYESIFGYNLEMFPKLGLKKGSVFALDSNGYYNCKHPASYVYPEQNGLFIGEHFKNKEKVKRFTSFKPIEFNTSIGQSISNVVTLLSIAACFSYFAIEFIIKIYQFILPK